MTLRERAYAVCCFTYNKEPLTGYEVSVSLIVMPLYDLRKQTRETCAISV